MEAPMDGQATANDKKFSDARYVAGPGSKLELTIGLLLIRITVESAILQQQSKIKSLGERNTPICHDGAFADAPGWTP